MLQAEKEEFGEESSACSSFCFGEIRAGLYISFTTSKYFGNIIESSKIKRIRGKLGLSQEKLARFADVSNNTIINIETGKQQNPTIDTIKKIAKALNVSIKDLIK